MENIGSAKMTYTGGNDGKAVNLDFVIKPKPGTYSMVGDPEDFWDEDGGIIFPAPPSYSTE